MKHEPAPRTPRIRVRLALLGTMLGVSVVAIVSLTDWRRGPVRVFASIEEIEPVANKGVPPIVRCSLRNLSDEGLWVSQDSLRPVPWLRSDEIFSVSLKGVEVPYKLPRIFGVETPRGRTETWLPAGGEVSVEVSLGDRYDMSVPGAYKAQLQGLATVGRASGWHMMEVRWQIAEVKSNSITVTVRNDGTAERGGSQAGSPASGAAAPRGTREGAEAP